MGRWLSHHLGDRVDGPFEPSTARLRTYYLQDMVIRTKNDGVELKRVKDLLRKAVDQLGKTEGLSGVRVVIDVDPY
jgi:primosomal protein N' (replication factor Y)